METELWDLYDRDRRKTGRQVWRGKDDLGPGEYHLVVTVVLFGSDGRMLIQQRQKDKAGWPGYWDLTVSGAVQAGEDARTGAMREVMEELGLTLDLSQARPRLTCHNQRTMHDVYVETLDVEPATLHLQESEVQAARYATREEILTLIDAGSFLPYKKPLIDLLFAMQGERGMLDL